MGIKVKIHKDFCVNRFHPRYHQAQRFLDSEVLRTSAPYVPMRSGELMRSGDKGTKIGSGEVEYNAPYAKRMYYGLSFNFSKDKHPPACAQCFEKTKVANIAASKNCVQKIIGGK